jgi:hypothetical protein
MEYWNMDIVSLSWNYLFTMLMEILNIPKYSMFKYVQKEFHKYYGFSLIQSGAPKIANWRVYNSNFAMVYRWYIYSIHGLYKPFFQPTYNWLGLYYPIINNHLGLGGWWFGGLYWFKPFPVSVFYFSNSWDDDPIWRTHIFQGGGSTTNQIYIHIIYLCY